MWAKPVESAGHIIFPRTPVLSQEHGFMHSYPIVLIAIVLIATQGFREVG